MSSKFDVARYHKQLSVGIFGGGTLALLIGTAVSFFNGNTFLGVSLGLAFLVIGSLAGWYFLDMFVWEPRRANDKAFDRMQHFREGERHREQRVRQRERGMRG